MERYCLINPLAAAKVMEASPDTGGKKREQKVGILTFLPEVSNDPEVSAKMNLMINWEGITNPVGKIIINGATFACKDGIPSSSSILRYANCFFDGTER
jgi:hypothetical protein